MSSNLPQDDFRQQEKGISAKVVSEIAGKTLKVILGCYNGTNDKVIETEMQKAFGVSEAKLK
jgi:hypothetical protein